MAVRTRLRVFVASSSEQSEVADRITVILRQLGNLHVEPWYQGVFQFSATYIESLEAELDKADFAVFVLTGDDRATVRRRRVKLPRDNLNFELGLFAGRLGRDRCIFFIDGDSHTKIASDLEGVAPAYFHRTRRGGAPSRGKLKAQVLRAGEQMMSLGPRYKPLPAVREEQQALWRFSSAVVGGWWERMRSREDDRSALSYVTMNVDETTNTPTMEGRAYGLDGKPLADWKSLSTGVVLGSRPRLYYRWQGQHEDETGQIYGGGGQIEFDPQLESGNGEFYDTNFAHLKDKRHPTRVKHFHMVRASAPEVAIMRDLWSAAAAGLIRGKLEKLKWPR